MEALNLDFSPILLVLVFKKVRGHFDDTLFQEFVMIKNACFFLMIQIRI